MAKKKTTTNQPANKRYTSLARWTENATKRAAKLCKLLDRKARRKQRRGEPMIGLMVELKRQQWLTENPRPKKTGRREVPYSG